MNRYDPSRPALRRLGTRAVCDGCVRATDDVLDVGVFGDYSACDRCSESKTNEDRAHFVRPNVATGGSR